jgi:hypothetical protein
LAISYDNLIKIWLAIGVTRQEPECLYTAVKAFERLLTSTWKNLSERVFRKRAAFY